jgi:O-acetyl-ADP-ribose deacetylase
VDERFEILVARIETLAVDAVVNAANRMLAPGTGVDGALRAAAGPDLTRATDNLGPIEVGDAVLTPGFALPARAIIHTAAPVFVQTRDIDAMRAGLARCYASSLAVAEREAFSSIAFPCLGTGNFGWPRTLACETALGACRAELASASSITRVIFCCFAETDAAPYREALKR